jgi:hypothetical protein
MPWSSVITKPQEAKLLGEILDSEGHLSSSLGRGFEALEVHEDVLT